MNPMKRAAQRGAYQRGMTLIEVLVVIAIIGILAGMLFPVLSKVKTKANIAKARKEMSDMKLAIEQYKSQYSILPMTSAARTAGNPDFTFGTYNVGSYAVNESAVNPGAGYQANNSELLFILMAETNAVYNPNHANNPQKKVFLNPPRDNQADGGPGIGPSRIWLDPWLNLYIVTVDANYDGVTQDPFFCRTSISQPSTGGANGLNGLVSKSGMATNDFVFRGEVMIWSMGPDGKADYNTKADDGVNKDNIMSWKF